VQLNPSAEKYALIGSAWKRKLVLYKKNKEKTKHAIMEAAKNYYVAYQKEKGHEGVYAFTNWFALENMLVLAKVHGWGKEIANPDGMSYKLPSAEEIQKTLKDMRTAHLKKPVIDKYWDRIVVPNIELGNWMLSAGLAGKGNKAADLAKVEESYLKVWKMAGSVNEKQIEIDNLDIIIDALTLLAPRHAILQNLKKLKERLAAAISK
jgi:hypothetical protein